MSLEEQIAAAQELARVLGEELLALPDVAAHDDSRFRGELTFVAARAAIDAVSAAVERQLGPPAKPAGAPTSDELKKDPLLDAMGGIRGDQTLYVKKLGEGLSLYVAYWPWGGGARVTIKIGIYAAS